MVLCRLAHHPHRRRYVSSPRQRQNPPINHRGMAAITAALVSVLQQGDRVLASSNLYGRTTQLLTNELTRFGVETTFVDTRDPRTVQAALQKPAKVLLLETISNPLLAVPDLPALVEIAHSRSCLVMVDNTFATPTLLKPLTLGVDLVMESLTKMIGGHSDVTLGFLGGTLDIFAQLSASVSIWGWAANPFDCWLATRGLATLDLRMKARPASVSLMSGALTEKPSPPRGRTMVSVTWVNSGNGTANGAS